MSKYLPCGCEAEKQYLDVVNNVLPKLGGNAMMMFIQSGFSISNLIESLFYALEFQDEQSKAYVGDKNVECLLRIGRILTRKVVVPREYLRHWKIAIYPRNHFLMGTEKDCELTMTVKQLTFQWDGRSKQGNMPILDLHL